MKLILIIIILTIAYILLGGLMKVAGKSTPSMPVIKDMRKKDN